MEVKKVGPKPYRKPYRSALRELHDAGEAYLKEASDANRVRLDAALERAKIWLSKH